MSVTEAMRHLADVGREYEQRANQAAHVYQDAARAEAAHRAGRARAALRYKESGERMSQAEAETRADADLEVAALYEDRLVKAALAESLKDKLRQLREAVASARTAVVDERAVDAGHARGYGGRA